MTPLNTSSKRFGTFQRAQTDSGLPRTAPEDEQRGRFADARRYGSLLKPHAWRLGLLFGLSLVGIAIDMVWPLVSAHLIDHVILSKLLATQQKVGELFGFALGMAGLLLFGA